MKIGYYNLEERHFKGWYDAYRSVTEERAFFSTDKPCKKADADSFLRDCIKNKFPFIVVVSEFGELIGWCYAVVLKAGRGELGIGVTSPYRGFHIGTKLLSLIEKQAAGRGIKHLSLHVREDNPTAIRLYEKNGYSLVKCRCVPVCLNGEEIGVLKYDKRL